ncbi:hypothetical protein J3R83DRAFT_3243 [Lanmaoa asiatica]|nr:hypothetical protein J3R83DRAFT_3243 [Lanmaoa asiatica]
MVTPTNLVVRTASAFPFTAGCGDLAEPNDLEQAISRHREAVDLIPHHHPNKPRCLNNLGTTLVARFRYIGELSDLEQAMLRYKEAIDLTLDRHPSKPGYLNDFGNTLRTRFKRLGELSDF